MNLLKTYIRFERAWKKVRGIVPFISLLSCLHKVYAEAPASLIFSGNDDKNVIAFLRMEVRDKMNSRRKQNEKVNFYWEAKIKTELF
jgi:hypothetical protein